jgi:hypothetical protein
VSGTPPIVVIDTNIFVGACLGAGASNEVVALYYLGIGWIKKYGRVKGLRRYEHVRSLVLNDAGRAFDATQVESDGFGPRMREDLRRRFRERRVAGDQLYDSTDDHLEGIAFSLTAQCIVIWSHAKPWESE